MRGHIITEDRFLHQGMDHHLFVSQADGAENEYRFEVRRIAPGKDQPETVYEKTEDLTAPLAASGSAVEELLKNEIELIKKDVFAEEEIHAHDP